MINDKTIQAAMRGDKEAARECTETEYLLPCPFCGEAGGLLHYDGDIDYLPTCTKCDGMVEEWYGSKELAIAAWNTRAPLPEEPNEPLTLEELREMDGQPVWTSATDIEGSGVWEIILFGTVYYSPFREVIRSANVITGVEEREIDTYGKAWLAYRRPPEVSP